MNVSTTDILHFYCNALLETSTRDIFFYLIQRMFSRITTLPEFVLNLLLSFCKIAWGLMFDPEFS